ncbi:MAG: hypothetical protein AB7I30_04485 [Isosphaeraceae bacterium]
MGGTIGPWPVVWAQVAGVSANAPTPVSNAAAMKALALRRWCASLTLSSPDGEPGFWPLWASLAGLGALLLLALVFQGPGRALRQVVNVAEHVRLVREATGRLRRAGRLITVTIGMTVLSWTGSQSFAYSLEQGKADVLLLTRSRGMVELALEQGTLAGLTPLRDLAGLASNLPLLILATGLLFRGTAEAWGVVPLPGQPMRPRLSGWATVGWTCGSFYVLYRLVALASGSWELPLGGCLVVEALVIPAVTLLADGVLMAWVLAELRESGYEREGGRGFDLREPIGLMPGAALACLVALPSRYVASMLLLVSLYLPASVATTPFGAYVRWQLGHGLIELQAAALALTGLVGATAWTRGGLGESWRGYVRLLRSQGGLLVVTFAMAGVLAGFLAGVAYLLVLSFPASTWVLAAADSYAHYGTLPVGLWTVSALIELAERSLPEAAIAREVSEDAAASAS